MIVFLAAFTVFNAVLALAALQRAIRLGAATWTGSPRLRAIALFTAWTLPFLCVGSTAAGWLKAGAEPHWAAPAVLAPLGWLIVMGLFFAIVDFAEDGVFDFGRGPPRKPGPGPLGPGGDVSQK